MLVTCRCHGKKIDRAIAYKVVLNGLNNYYCSKDEYDKILKRREVKNNTYQAIFNLFGRKVTNTLLFKEVNELASIYGYDTIYSYIEDGSESIETYLHKGFRNEQAKIKYFVAILKNNLYDYSENHKEVTTPKIRDAEEEIVIQSNYKPKKQRKTLDDYEEVYTE
jgi:hypothetical protein